MPYNSKNAKPVYYKQNVTTFVQLFNNIIRLQYDSRISGSTAAQYIENMFNRYLQHAQTQQQHNCANVKRIKHAVYE